MFAADERDTPKLQEIELSDAFSREMMSRHLTKKGTYSLSLFQPLMAKTADEKNVLKAIHDHKPKHFIFDSSDVVRNLFGSLKEEPSGGNKETGFNSGASAYFRTIVHAEMIMLSLLNDVKYLGPVRNYPRRFYEYSGEYHPEVGPRGEHTYSLLFQLSKDKNKMAALDSWVTKFGLAKSVLCRAVEKRSDLLEIVAKDIRSGLTMNFADTCFGLSQTLPLLVQSIMSEPGDMVITEQPEIHLNPNCETILADFFVEESRKRKCSFVVETHSEHLLLRLRTHIRQGNISADNVGIYFTEPSENGCSVREIVVNDDGDFPNDDWPKGFFGQALAESMLFATTSRRKGKSK